MAHTKVTKNGTQNTGAVNTFSYSGSFDVFKSTEVKVDLDNVTLTYTASTINESASPREYTVDITAKTVHIGGANLAASNAVVIRPFTDMGAPTPRASYTPGASITSDDLNNNQLQLMRKAMEYDEQKLSSTGGTMTGDINLDKNVDIVFEGATEDAHETTLTVSDPTADRTITLPNATGTVPVLAVHSDTAITATATELNYVDGVTSAIQTQLDAKQAAGSYQPLDADLTELSSMQTGASAKLKLLTADEIEKIDELTASTAELNKLDGYSGSTDNLNIVNGMTKQTTISDQDTSYPTSGAVVDYVAAQLSGLTGVEVIADDESFKNSIPAAGTIISISNAGGLQINSSGVSTNGDTLDNSTVTINGFPSELRGGVGSNADPYVLADGTGLLVKSTGSSQTYDYCQVMIREADFVQLSDDINDFNSRYRIGSSDPGSANDEGDLFFNTSANKMKVYDGSAWGEVTSTGEFKYLVLCNAGTTNTATYNGSDVSYDLKETSTSGSAASVTSAAQLIVSVNGVIQKPNTGTSTGGLDGFVMTDADTIKFSAGPPANAEVFVVQIGSATQVSVPANDSVTAAKLDLAIVAGDVIYGSGTDTWQRLPKPSSNKFLRNTSGGSLSWETVDSTPEGTAIKSTGESGGTKFLREDGDNTCSWQEVIGAVADGCIYENSQTISNNYQIDAGKGAHSVGPITVNATVTVNGNWVVS